MLVVHGVVHGDAPVSTVERAALARVVTHTNHGTVTPPTPAHRPSPGGGTGDARTLGDDRDVPLVEEPFPQLVRLVERR